MSDMLQLFQMHPDRRSTIQNATGIDMVQGSVLDQCKGVFWELQNVELVAYRKLKEAEKLVVVEQVKFKNMAYRRDIGGQLVNQCRSV